LTANLQAELWTSWAAVLRSYASLHGLNAPQHAVVEVSGNEITLRVGSRWTRFTPEEIVDSRGVTMRFRLNENGSVSREGHVDEEMDLAAEEIAREMLHNS
jgi:hypothetical protein